MWYSKEYAMYCGLGASSFTLQVTFDLKHKIWCRGDRQLVPNSTTVCKDSIHWRLCANSLQTCLLLGYLQKHLVMQIIACKWIHAPLSSLCRKRKSVSSPVCLNHFVGSDGHVQCAQVGLPSTLRGLVSLYNSSPSPFLPPSHSLPFRHHSMNSAAILLYAFTSCVSGFVSAKLFRKLGGHNWVWNVVLTASLFAAPFFVVWSLVNSVAWYHNSTQALPFTTIILILFIWVIGESCHVTVAVWRKWSGRVT